MSLPVAGVIPTPGFKISFDCDIPGDYPFNPVRVIPSTK